MLRHRFVNTTRQLPTRRREQVRAFQSLDVVGQSTRIGRKLPELRSDETSLTLFGIWSSAFRASRLKTMRLSHGRLAPSTLSRACYIGRNCICRLCLRVGMPSPNIVADLAHRYARAARAPARERFARGCHLVPRRRAGRGAVLAGGRGRSRLFPLAAAGRGAGERDRARLEPDRARRRRARRRHPPRRQGLRHDRGRGRRPGPGRRRDAGREGRARRRRRLGRRARLLSRHPGRDRRRVAHERRRAWRRDHRRPRRGARRRPSGQRSGSSAMPTWALPTATPRRPPM